jgi:hypothetical protein
MTEAQFLLGGLMARKSADHTEGWLFRVIDPNVPQRRYFVVGSAVLEDARQLLQAHPDVDENKIEAVGPVSVPNMLKFKVRHRYALSVGAPTLRLSHRPTWSDPMSKKSKKEKKTVIKAAVKAANLS